MDTKAEHKRIDDLLASGRIGAEDHRLLIDALERKASPVHRLLSLLANPFSHLSSTTALVLGLLFIAALGVLGAQSSLYFPGVLDIQILSEGQKALGVVGVVIENSVNTATLALVYYLCALIGRQRNLRLIDFAGSVAFSRLPYALFAGVAMFFSDLTHHRAEQPPNIQIVAISIIAIVFLIWNLLLVFSALKESSGMKGKALWTSYILGVVVAEAISYVLNVLILK